MSKNTFQIFGDTIHITRPDWDFFAQATIREDYINEIQSVTWGLKNYRYPNNSTLGTLHSYIMKKWYGEEVCNDMKNKGFVIDHMNNNSADCRISNLCFLSNAQNKAKGLTFDQENKEKGYIALSISKDFYSGLFQITIVFNCPARLDLEGIERNAAIELVYLLYQGDYRIVINEAENILYDYYNEGVFKPGQLRMVDYHIEGRYGTPISREQYDDYIMNCNAQGHGMVFFHLKAPIQNWTLENKQEFFTLRDIDTKTSDYVRIC